MNDFRIPRTNTLLINCDFMYNSLPLSCIDENLFVETMPVKFRFTSRFRGMYLFVQFLECNIYLYFLVTILPEFFAGLFHLPFKITSSFFNC